MIRDLKSSDYFKLCGWWASYDFPAPPAGILPKTGYMSDEMAAAFLYLTNSNVAWMAWAVADKNAPTERRSKAIDEVVNHVSKSAKITGATVVFTTASAGPFKRRLKRLGYVAGDKTTHFLKVV